MWHGVMILLLRRRLFSVALRQLSIYRMLDCCVDTFLAPVCNLRARTEDSFDALTLCLARMAWWQLDAHLEVSGPATTFNFASPTQHDMARGVDDFVCLRCVEPHILFCSVLDTQLQ